MHEGLLSKAACEKMCATSNLQPIGADLKADILEQLRHVLREDSLAESVCAVWDRLHLARYTKHIRCEEEAYVANMQIA